MHEMHANAVFDSATGYQCEAPGGTKHEWSRGESNPSIDAPAGLPSGVHAHGRTQRRRRRALDEVIANWDQLQGHERSAIVTIVRSSLTAAAVQRMATGTQPSPTGTAGGGAGPEQLGSTVDGTASGRGEAADSGGQLLIDGGEL
ncbi:MAG: hypothetical protein AAF995_00280 [Planctomycetota bacterium]